MSIDTRVNKYSNKLKGGSRSEIYVLNNEEDASIVNEEYISGINTSTYFDINICDYCDKIKVSFLNNKAESLTYEIVESNSYTFFVFEENNNRDINEINTRVLPWLNDQSKKLELSENFLNNQIIFIKLLHNEEKITKLLEGNGFYDSLFTLNK